MNQENDYCLIGNSTDVGRVRKANEDSMDCFDSPNGRVVVVCDGMGGHVGGQVASQTAIKAIREFLTNNRFDDMKDAMTNAIVTANQAILHVAAEKPELSGMGSTCVLLIVNKGQVYYAHVGDSRIYFVANHRINQITKDQSFVQMLVDAGHITEEEAEHHPRKNEITNAMGFAEMTPPILCTNPIIPEAGNCFVLCSDGLSGMVAKNVIEHVVSKHEVPIQQRAEKLVKLANEAGGVDNITVQLVEFAVNGEDINPSTSTSTSSVSEPPKSKMKIIIGALLAIVILACGAYFLMNMKKSKGSKETATGITKKGFVSTVAAVSGDTIMMPAIQPKSGEAVISIPNDKITDKINDFSCKVVAPTDGTVTFIKFVDRSINTFKLDLENLKSQTTQIVLCFGKEKKVYYVVIPLGTQASQPAAPKSVPVAPAAPVVRKAAPIVKGGGKILQPAGGKTAPKATAPSAQPSKQAQPGNQGGKTNVKGGSTAPAPKSTSPAVPAGTEKKTPGTGQA